jgi:hypothetical protein
MADAAAEAVSNVELLLSAGASEASVAVDHQLRVFGSYDRGLLALRDAGRTYLRIQVHLSYRSVDLDHRVSRCPLIGGGLNRSTQHFILEGKDGVWDGTKIS